MSFPMEKCYKMNNDALKLFNFINIRHNDDKIIRYILAIFSKYFNISVDSCDSFVKNILLAQKIRGYDVNKKRAFAFVPFLFMVFLKNIFKIKSIIKADILFDNSVSRWIEVNDIVSNEIKTFNLHKYIDKSYDVRTVVKILIFLFKNFYILLLLLYISIKYRVNYIAHFHRLLLEILENESLVQYINCSIYFTSNMDACSFIKKEQFNKAGMKIFLMQIVAIDYYISSYIAADIFFAFGQNQIDIALRVGSKFDEVHSIGSLKSIEKSKKTAEGYNMVFIEQVANFDEITYTSNAEYKNLVYNLIKFSEEYSDVKIAFLSRIQFRYSIRDKIINQHFKTLYEDLEVSNIKIVHSENNYPYVKQSNLVISYFSTLCFEAIGLDSLGLFCFNNPVNNYELLYNVEDKCILSDSSYELFKERVLYMLNIDKKTKENLIENMKINHMNTSEKSLDIVLSSIKSHIY